MEQKGLVVSRVESRPGVGPPRRLYQPTALGLRLCQALKPLRGGWRLGVAR
jgi:DNA-binding PadR family transcriptional regulator